jgi:putative transposase
MIRTQLDDITHDELQALRREPIPPRVRDRIEMVLLSDAGWSAPRIAIHLGVCGQTVRDLLRAFLARGLAALYPFRSGPAPNRDKLDRVAEELRRLLAEDRTWTSRQLGQALADQGIVLGPRQVRRYLRRIDARYHRTAWTLKHKQDPVKVERAGRILENLKAKADAGDLTLYYLDECGFAPTLPISYSWSLPGQRKRVRYEASQRRRVNAMAAYRPYGRTPRLDVFTAERTWDSYDLLGFVKALPWSSRPRVVVLDNASFHTSAVIRRARAVLCRLGIYLYYLPAYSPELNLIEPVFRQVKHQELPQRSFTTRRELRTAVETGFSHYGENLPSNSPKRRRPAA